MFFDKLQNRWVINEENARQIRKTVKNMAPDIQTSHTSTRQWAKVEPAHIPACSRYISHVFIFFALLLNLFCWVKSLINRNAVQSLCWLQIQMKKKKKANKRTDVWIHQQIHTCEVFTKLEELRHRMNTVRKSGIHMYMISTDNGFPSFLQII